jgi:activator of HSP90 ATPase
MTITPKFPAATHSLGRRRVITAGTLTMVGLAVRSAQSSAEPNAEISTNEEAIRQLRVFRAARQRVYEALTLESQFDKIVELSGVTKSAQKPTKLSPQAGGTFALFAGHIVGRQVELVPNELIVQAWRVVTWPRGIYSIARFELSDQGGAAKLVFTHTAFPKGQAEHLASGWQEHYWDPLTKLLA